MGRLANMRILVVEDEFLIASVLCDMLEGASAIVVGPARTVAEALHLLNDNVVEAALVDMNLNGQWSDPIAEELKSRRIPFVFTTGYGSNERTERFGVRVVGKPYSWDDVEHQLTLSVQDAAQLSKSEAT